MTSSCSSDPPVCARTAANTLENFVLFAGIALVAHSVVPTSALVLRGAEVFFWSRLAFVPIYYAGIRYLRTAAWAASIVGLAMMVVGVVSA